MRVAIIHYWIIADRGGEKVVQALCKMFPQAVIYTHVADPEIAQRLFPGHEIRFTRIAKLPFARRHYQKYLPLMPAALEELDLGEFDLILSSESGPAKGIIPPPRALHVCYCHSPMRYVWDHYHLYKSAAGPIARLAMSHFAPRLRLWDATSAMRVDHFAANSAFVAARIGKYYRREATVIAPPVDVSRYLSVNRQNETADRPYLWVGQLTAYKNAELAVRAFNESGKSLHIVGDGEERRKLERIAGPHIRFLGRVSHGALLDAYATARALIFPGEEDFGMVPVEAMAAGLPVIAWARGGALETVKPQLSGVLFDEPSVDALNEAVEQFEATETSFDVSELRAHAKTFDQKTFLTKFRTLLTNQGVRNDEIHD
ncbi:MAG: glycosyltransferase [Pseudomonadota bacterium]